MQTAWMLCEGPGPVEQKEEDVMNNECVSEHLYLHQYHNAEDMSQENN